MEIFDQLELYVFWKEDPCNLSPFYKANQNLLCSIVMPLMIYSFLNGYNKIMLWILITNIHEMENVATMREMQNGSPA